MRAIRTVFLSSKALHSASSVASSSAGTVSTFAWYHIKISLSYALQVHECTAVHIPAKTMKLGMPYVFCTISGVCVRRRI